MRPHIIVPCHGTGCSLGAQCLPGRARNQKEEQVWREVWAMCWEKCVLDSEVKV